MDCPHCKKQILTYKGYRPRFFMSRLVRETYDQLSTGELVPFGDIHPKKCTMYRRVELLRHAIVRMNLPVYLHCVRGIGYIMIDHQTPNVTSVSVRSPLTPRPGADGRLTQAGRHAHELR